jgi:DNA recombination protein RmuC
MMYQNIWIFSISTFVAGLILSAVITWLWCRTSAQQEGQDLKIRFSEVKTERDGLSGRLEKIEEALSAGQSENAQLKTSLAEAQTERNSLRTRLESLDPEYAGVREENERLRIHLAQLKENQAADAEKIQWIEAAQTQMREAFQALASRTMQQHSDIFLKYAREHVETLVGQMRGDWNTQKAEFHQLVEPVRENLTRLDTHVRELEQKREGAYQGLTEQIHQLSRAHAEVQRTALTLTQALKSPTVRGRWGEIQLRRVVEMAGMVNHVAFEEQAARDGSRPDMVIHLPNAGILPVDSKVPLKFFLEAAEAADDADQKQKMIHHAKAMRDRVRDLSQKKYWEQFSESPDFVVMFVPNEACLSAAFENDPNLMEDAIQQKILLTTPITLIALLKSVAYGWKQHQITENAQHIAGQGRELCKRIETFVEHLGDLRNHLNRAVEGYNKTVSSLERRLMPAARKFQELNAIGPEMNSPEWIQVQAK